MRFSRNDTWFGVARLREWNRGRVGVPTIGGSNGEKSRDSKLFETLQRNRKKMLSTTGHPNRSRSLYRFDGQPELFLVVCHPRSPNIPCSFAKPKCIKIARYCCRALSWIGSNGCTWAAPVVFVVRAKPSAATCRPHAWSRSHSSSAFSSKAWRPGSFAYCGPKVLQRFCDCSLKPEGGSGYGDGSKMDFVIGSTF
jgi:hypothetical protein